MITRTWLPLLAFEWLVAVSAAAVTIHVPGDHATLAGAVAASAPGDRIEVAAGTYSRTRTGEHFPIELATHDVLIRGAGAGTCILDGERRSRLFWIGPDNASRLEGFTLTGGHADGDGGAVLCEQSNPRISRIHFTANEAEASGDAFAARGGSPQLTNCLFEGNGPDGPTAVLTGGEATLSLNTFHGNGGVALEIRAGAGPRITDNIFSDPGAPGRPAPALVIESADGARAPTLERLLFAGCGEGAIRVRGAPGPVLERTLREARLAGELTEGDPQFVAPEAKDFRLRIESPQWKAGQIGAFGGLSPLSFPGPAKISERGAKGDEGLLGPSIPNPFTPATTVHFEVKRATVVDLAVYDVLGRRVRTLHAGDLSAGSHTSVWDGRDDHGEELPPGGYFVRVTQGRVTETRRVVLVR